jgi:NAD(P)-dependent dehydrogenase (short-subunit alcohol dehydrogenase family)
MDAFHKGSWHMQTQTQAPTQGRVAIVTGASSGIGLDITKALLGRGYAVVATSRRASERGTLVPSVRLAVVDGDVGRAETAARVVEQAVARFDRVDLLVNNAGIFMAKPFTDHTAAEYDALVSTNLAGFVHMTQAVLRKMVPQRRGHVVNISTSLVGQPIAGVPSAMSILTKGGIEAASRSLAIEYAGQGIRFNTVAPGIVDTPMHAPSNHEALRGLSPSHRIGTVEDVTAAVLYLEAAPFVSGEIIHVDGGAHAGRW